MIVCQTEQEQRVWDAAYGSSIANSVLMASVLPQAFTGLTDDERIERSRLSAEIAANMAVQSLRKALVDHGSARTR